MALLVGWVGAFAAIGSLAVIGILRGVQRFSLANLDRLSFESIRPGIDDACEHGDDRYTCLVCHKAREAAGLYAQECAEGEHDLPLYRFPSVYYHCLECGWRDMWHH